MFSSHGKVSLVVILWLAVALFAASPSQGGGTITENFDNNQYNQNLWWVENMGAGVTSVVTNNSLQITLPASSGGTLYMGMMGGAFTLSGDFEMVVAFDLSLLPWPADNQAQITLGIDQGNDFSISRRSSSLNEGGEKYFTMIKGDYSELPASGTSGKLRMKRIGSTMEGAYWNGSNWVVVGSGTDPSFGAYFGVHLSLNRDTSFSGPIVKGAFDNISLIYDKIIYENNQGNPAGGILLLLMD
jgi:hypothetical protein